MEVDIKVVLLLEEFFALVEGEDVAFLELAVVLAVLLDRIVGQMH